MAGRTVTCTPSGSGRACVMYKCVLRILCYIFESFAGVFDGGMSSQAPLYQVREA